MVQYFQSEGVQFDPDQPVTSEMFAEAFPKISDMSNAAPLGRTVPGLRKQFRRATADQAIPRYLGGQAGFCAVDPQHPGRGISVRTVLARLRRRATATQCISRTCRSCQTYPQTATRIEDVG